MACQLNKSWQCILCHALYSTLPKLISHLRSAHSHDPGLCFACGIDGCPKTFKNTNTYYKHVTSVHKNRYTENSDVVLVKESLQTKHNAAKACSTTEDDSDIDIDIN